MTSGMWQAYSVMCRCCTCKHTGVPAQQKGGSPSLVGWLCIQNQGTWSLLHKLLSGVHGPRHNLKALLLHLLEVYITLPYSTPCWIHCILASVCTLPQSQVTRSLIAYKFGSCNLSSQGHNLFLHTPKLTLQTRQ